MNVRERYWFSGGKFGPTNRAVQYGDGVFRTVLVHRGKAHEGLAQYRHLCADAQGLALSPPDEERFFAWLADFLAQEEFAALKISLLPGEVGKGYARTGAETECLLQLKALPQRAPELWTQGIRVRTCELRLAPQTALAGIKHLNRLEQVLAAREWQSDASVQEALLTDQAGHLISGSMSNVFWLKAGRLYTPAITDCGVAGHTRQQLLHLAKQLGLELEIGKFSAQECQRQADGLFLCNSLIGIWPICQWDDYSYAIPQVTRDLQQALQHPLMDQYL